MNVKLYKSAMIDILKPAFVVIILFAMGMGKIDAQDTLASAQDSLVIGNVFASFNSNSVFKNDSIRAQKDTAITLNVGFKVNYPGSVSEIFVLMGSTKDNSDYQSYHYNVGKENGVNVIYQDTSPISKFWKKDALIKTSVPPVDIYKIKWITIYCKDTFGKLSGRKYFNIQ